MYFIITDRKLNAVIHEYIDKNYYKLRKSVYLAEQKYEIVDNNIKQLILIYVDLEEFTIDEVIIQVSKYHKSGMQVFITFTMNDALIIDTKPKIKIKIEM